MMRRSNHYRGARLSVADQLLQIAIHSDEGRRLINELLPKGPANHTHQEQAEALKAVEEALRARR